MDPSRLAWVGSTLIGSCVVVGAVLHSFESGGRRLALARERGVATVDPKDPALRRDALCAIEMSTDRPVRDLEIAVYDERELLRESMNAEYPRRLPEPIARRSTAEIEAKQAARIRDVGYGRKLVEMTARTAEGTRLVSRPAWVYVHDGLGSVPQRIEWNESTRRTIRAISQSGAAIARQPLVLLGPTWNSSAVVTTADDGTFECAATDAIALSLAGTALYGLLRADDTSGTLVLFEGEPHEVDPEQLAATDLPALANAKQLHPWDLGSPLWQVLRTLRERTAEPDEPTTPWVTSGSAQPPRKLDEMRAGDSLHTFVRRDLPIADAPGDGLLIVRTNRTYERVSITDLRGVELVRGISDRYGELVVTGLPSEPVLIFSSTWSGERTRTSGAIPGSDTEVWLADVAAPPLAPDRADVIGFVADEQQRPIGGGTLLAQFYPRPGHFGHRTDTIATRGFFRLTDLPAGEPVDLMLRDPPGRAGSYRFVNYRSRRIVPTGGRENVMPYVLESGGIDVRVAESVATTGNARLEIRHEGDEEVILSRRLAQDARQLEVLGMSAGRYSVRITVGDDEIAFEEIVPVLETNDATERAKQGG